MQCRGNRVLVLVAVVSRAGRAEGGREPVGWAHEGRLAQDKVRALLVPGCDLAGGYRGGARVSGGRIRNSMKHWVIMSQSDRLVFPS